MKKILPLLIYVLFLALGSRYLKLHQLSLESFTVSQKMSLKANQLFYYEYLGEFVITAYSSTPEETDSTPFITASNKRVRDGFIACPRYMKFGTRVVIDGKSYVCEDVMNERYSKHFDIWFSTRSEAIKFGRVIKKVYAIK